MAQITDFVTGFSGPIGMALNGDDLYVVDIVASKIVKIDLTIGTKVIKRWCKQK